MTIRVDQRQMGPKFERDTMTESIMIQTQSVALHFIADYYPAAFCQKNYLNSFGDDIRL